jgi:hypothetical protein
MSVSQFQNLLQKARVLQKLRSDQELYDIVEKYHTAKGSRLAEATSDATFREYVQENPLLLPINQEMQ